MDNTTIALLSGLGGGAISALIAYAGNRSVNTANTAKLLTEAAKQLIEPLQTQINTLENTVRDLKCEISDLKKENVRISQENVNLKERVKFLEDALSKNGLAHLIKKYPGGERRK